LSGRGLCDELITRPEESYRLWCVVVCDLETSWVRRPWAHWGAVAPKNKQPLKMGTIGCSKTSVRNYHYSPLTKNSFNSLLLKMGPLSSAETSVKNYNYTRCNNPEERSSHLLCGGGLKLGTW